MASVGEQIIITGMYLPARFQTADEDDIHRLVHTHPLATLISVRDASPFVSHLPLLLENRGERLVLIGHLARANPHCGLLAGGEACAVFNGPNAYISPRWYDVDDVPTWNYAVVHMRGRAQLIEDFEGILECLKKLSAFAEADVETPWEFWLPRDLSDPAHLVRAIAGFEIEVESVEAKFKLSQQRPQDRDGVIAGLARERSDSGSAGIAVLMKKHVKN